MGRLGRRYKDRDFIQTPEGLLFCVIGYQHPPDRVISYLKYVPSPTGEWGFSGLRFSRSMRAYTTPELLKNIDWLKENYPRYVFHSDVFSIEISAVLIEDIRRYYYPEERLQQLLEKGPADLLEDTALRLIKLLSERSGVSLDSFGITGSILLGIHNPRFSDIDVVIYGRENSLKIKDTLNSIYQEKDRPLRRLSGSELNRWCADKAKSYPVSREEAERFYHRKWNYGLFGDRLFSIHPTKMNHEIVERYGDEVYRPIGLAEIEATITEIPEPIFIPHIYEVKDVIVKEGGGANKITQIVTQEGFYGDIVKVGERIIARGKLERVVRTSSNETYYRIFIGSPEARGRDFIKPLSLLRSEAC